MASAGQLFFVVGVIAVALAFAAHVGHAVLLANGRRSLPQLVPTARPAYAGVVTGAFAEHLASGAPTGPAADPVSPISRRAQVAGTHRGDPARPVPGGPGARRGSRAVGQHVRVHRRLRVHDPGGLPDPRAALPDPIPRLRPVRGRPRPAPLRQQPAERRQAARAGSPERPPPDDPRRDGHDLPTASSPRASQPESAISSRARPTGSPGCRRTRSSTRSPTGR